MKALVATTAAALLLAAAAQAQTPPGQTPPPAAAAGPPVSDLTRDLNSGPPAPAVYLAPAPAPVAPPPAAAAPTPSPRPATTGAPSIAAPPSAPPAIATPPRAAPIPAALAPQPRTAPITPPAATAAPRTRPLTAAPAPVPTPATAPAPVIAPAPPAAAPAVTVLDAAARAALPFTADLPPGFEIVSGRPGPDFRIYTIRRASQSFVMIYTGPASQFPIYSGQMVEAGGRASIVATEDGQRHALEHLFQRSTAPQEVHVWTMSLDGADRAMAEQIAQSIDVR